MYEIDDAGILDHINTLVSDKFQVVSYKWLSRNFLVSSDVAKRLLSEFVDKRKTGFEIVYALAGWLKGGGTRTYHVRLVSGCSLSEARQEFEGGYSLHIYSVQPSVPKDPVALWNTEFVQAEELFKQIPTIPNCLRDNRFCGVSNTVIKRNSFHSEPVIEQKPVAEGNLKKQKNHIVNCNSSKVPDPINNLDGNKEKPVSIGFETKSQNDGGGSAVAAGGGSSLGDLWSRASVRPKPNITDATKTAPNPKAEKEASVGAEGRGADEEGESEDEGGGASFKRCRNGIGSGRKRKVFMDMWEDEEDKEEEKEGGESLRCCSLSTREEKEHVDEPRAPGGGGAGDAKAGRPNNAPKKKKKMITRVDDRGREVTEVVWEEEDERGVSNGKEKEEGGRKGAASSDNIKREVAVVVGEGRKKSRGGGGNKKAAAGVKDRKQGNILSFFNKL